MVLVTIVSTSISFMSMSSMEICTQHTWQILRDVCACARTNTAIHSWRYMCSCIRMHASVHIGDGRVEKTGPTFAMHSGQSSATVAVMSAIVEEKFSFT